MSKARIAKLAVKYAAGLGVSKVINDIISNNTTVDNTEDQIKVAVGSLVLGSIVMDHASEHVDAKLQKVSDWYNDRQDAKKEAPVQ
jgi:F0F1-type ATP synthase beta subunit